MISMYEQMEQLAYNNDIMIITHCLPDKLSGYCYLSTDHGIKTITLNKKLSTTAEKACVLAEELEHYISTPEDLFIAPKPMQEKYESIARFNAVKKLMPLDKLIDARRRRLCDVYELADYLGITSEFLESGLKAYKVHYGSAVPYRDFIIYFDPFNVEKAC
jgi:hypothetical protein